MLSCGRDDASPMLRGPASQLPPASRRRLWPTETITTIADSVSVRQLVGRALGLVISALRHSAAAEQTGPRCLLRWSPLRRCSTRTAGRCWSSTPTRPRHVLSRQFPSRLECGLIAVRRSTNVQPLASVREGAEARAGGRGLDWSDVPAALDDTGRAEWSIWPRRLRLFRRGSVRVTG